MKKIKISILITIAFATSQIFASVSTQFLFMTPSAPINSTVSAIIRVACVDNNAYVAMSNSRGTSLIQMIGMKNECEVNNTVNEISFVQSVPISNMQSGIFRKHCINNLQFISYSPRGAGPTISQTIKNGQAVGC